MKDEFPLRIWTEHLKDVEVRARSEKGSCIPQLSTYCHWKWCGSLFPGPVRQPQSPSTSVWQLNHLDSLSGSETVCCPFASAHRPFSARRSWLLFSHSPRQWPCRGGSHRAVLPKPQCLCTQDTHTVLVQWDGCTGGWSRPVWQQQQRPGPVHQAERCSVSSCRHRRCAAPVLRGSSSPRSFRTCC